MWPSGNSGLDAMSAQGGTPAEHCLRAVALTSVWDLGVRVWQSETIRLCRNRAKTQLRNPVFRRRSFREPELRFDVAYRIYALHRKGRDSSDQLESEFAGPLFVLVSSRD